MRPTVAPMAIGVIKIVDFGGPANEGGATKEGVAVGALVEVAATAVLLDAEDEGENMVALDGVEESNSTLSFGSRKDTE